MDSERYIDLEHERPFSRPVGCRRCGCVVDEASIEIHDRWHDRLDLLSVQLDEVDTWMAARSG